MIVSKLTWLAYKRFLARPIAELDRFRCLDAAGQRQEMARRLLAQIQYFGRRGDALPEWREAARIRQPEELWKIWPSLPVVTKASLNAHFEPLGMQRRFGLRGRLDSTGGSTGEPTRFFLDNPMLRASRAAHLYSRLRMGWKPGMPTIIVWGSERDIGKRQMPLQRLAHLLYGDHMVPGFEIDGDSIARILTTVRTNSPVAIYGYSSLLDLVARKVLASGEIPQAGSVAVAWNGGEMLHDEQVQLFKRAFSVPILNRYGGRELSVTAFQEQEGGPLRLLRPWIFLEIVNDAGKPCPAGEPGRMLLTSTICRATPFLRYEVGDVGDYGEDDSDESGIRRMRTLHGRNSGLTRLSNGRVISSIYWNHLLKEYSEIVQFQVRVAATGRISLLLTGSGFSEARSGQLRAALGHLLRDQPVEFAWVDAIPRSPQGKLLHVVHES